jgi:hypothetical protein
MNANANVSEPNCLRCGRKASERNKARHDCFYTWDCAMGSLYKHGLEIKKEQKKKYLREKIECECGCEVSRANIARHRRSKQHEKKMTKKLCDDEECPCVATPLDDSYEKCELCDGYYHPDKDYILIEEIGDEECCLCGRCGSIATGNLVQMKCSGDITCDAACDDEGDYQGDSDSDDE